VLKREPKTPEKSRTKTSFVDVADELLRRH